MGDFLFFKNSVSLIIIDFYTNMKWRRAKILPQKAAYHKGQDFSLDASREELKQLKKENATLRQERDILKKAAAYFAREIK